MLDCLDSCYQFDIRPGKFGFRISVHWSRKRRCCTQFGRCHECNVRPLSSFGRFGKLAYRCFRNKLVPLDSRFLLGKFFVRRGIQLVDLLAREVDRHTVFGGSLRHIPHSFHMLSVQGKDRHTVGLRRPDALDNLRLIDIRSYMFALDIPHLFDSRHPDDRLVYKFPDRIVRCLGSLDRWHKQVGKDFLYKKFLPRNLDFPYTVARVLVHRPLWPSDLEPCHSCMSSWHDGSPRCKPHWARTDFPDRDRCSDCCDMFH